jgi:cation:H+ antiporter
VTAIAAVRLGSYDLAVGNLFGSNAINMFVFLFVDIAYRPGPLFANAADAQVLAAMMGVLLTATGMMGIIYRTERRYFLLEPDAVALALAYVGGMWLVYQAGT